MLSTASRDLTRTAPTSASERAERLRTRVVATVGPASSSPEVLGAMIDAGVDVVRLGFAHGTIDEHLDHIRLVRSLATERGRVVGVLADLPGPKVRSGPVLEPTQLADHTVVRMVPDAAPSSSSTINVEYDSLLDDLRPDDYVSLGDGAVVLRIDAVGGSEATAVILHGGMVEGRPGVHLPAGRMRLSAPTEDDLHQLTRCVAEQVDMVAVSFVKHADDLRKVRAAAGAECPLLVAKIETPLAVANINTILDEADAVMVARGDLGTECPLEDVPHLQKSIVRASVLRRRPVIIATQMLESMTHTTSPTRAEASDVANAVLDGADALMLSGETAIGVDPVEAVRTMVRIASRAEEEADYATWGDHVSDAQAEGPITTAMTHAAWRAARDSGATAILCCTRSGTTVRAMASLRPEAAIVALSPSHRTRGQLSLSWGVAALPVTEYGTTDEMVNQAVSAARQAGCITTGDVVAVLAGSPLLAQPGTDVLRLLRVD